MTPEEILAHYGVKGMHWGIRKEEETGGQVKKAKDLNKYSVNSQIAQYSEFQKKIRKDLEEQGIDSEQLRAKYGPPQADAKRRLTDNEKLLIGLGLGIAVVGGGIYASHYFNEKELAALGPARTLWETRQNVYLKAANNGLAMHWEEGVSLDAGSIFKRISTVAETEIRPGGFYAAFADEDVQRYKAILPTFWRDWGVGSPADGGFINHYKALTSIKAPSGKDTLSIFEDLVKSNSAFQGHVGLFGSDVSKLPQSELKKYFSNHALLWANPDLPATKIFFDAVKEKGYNALIDFNDAGALSKTPMRLIDGSMFEISAHEPLGLKDMLSAAESVSAAMAHILEDLIRNPAPLGGAMKEEDRAFVEDFLEHHGVKGMKWGVRQDRGHEGERAKTKTIAKADKKYDQSFKGAAGWVKVNNAIADKINPKLDVLNAKPAYQVDMTKPEHAATHKKYINEYRGLLQQSLNEAMDEFGSNASGTQRQHLVMVGEGLDTSWEGYTEVLQHDAVMARFNIIPKFNDKGQIIDQLISPVKGHVSHDDLEDFIEHYGVKGMHWGVRKAEKLHDTANRNRRIAEGTATRRDKIDQAVLGKGMKGFGGALSLNPKVAGRLADRYDKKANKQDARNAAKDAAGGRGAIRRGATKANTALDAGRQVIDAGEKKLIFLPQEKRKQAASRTQGKVLGEAIALNRDPRFNGKDLKKNPVLREAYHQEIKKQAVKIYQEELGIARSEATADFIKAVMAPSYDSLSMSAPRDRIRHADSNDEVLLTLHFDKDELGQIIGIKVEGGSAMHFDDDDFLEHYGVKGMHWGVRKEADDLGVPRKTAATAKKDAEEFTRAKMFYGQGAGNRRKLIKATVEQRMKDPQYKKAFDHYVNRTDLAKRSDQAKSQRRRKDVSNSTRRTVRGVKNTILNNGAPVTAAALAIGTGAKYAHDQGLDKKAAAAGKQAIRGLFKHEESDEDFLEHYGIKGMRWGVRRDPGADGRVDPTPVSVTQPRPGTKLAATGGQNHPAHTDATQAAAARQKARASTLASLSNDELQKTVRRMQLEQQYSQLMTQRQGKSAVKKGSEVIKGLLGMGKTVNEVMAFQNSPAGKELSKSMTRLSGGKKAA